MNPEDLRNIPFYVGGYLSKGWTIKTYVLSVLGIIYVMFDFLLVQMCPTPLAPIQFKSAQTLVDSAFYY